jgi:hypothetical protein
VLGHAPWRGEWLGVAATGRRFEDVDEIYLFRIENGKLSSAIGVEGNVSRMRQLGIRVTGLEADALPAQTQITDMKGE